MISATEPVSISFHETYYCLYGEETDNVLRVTNKELHRLADEIKDTIPKPSPIQDAKFIRGLRRETSGMYVLAKIDGQWYDDTGATYTEEAILRDILGVEVIK